MFANRRLRGAVPQLVVEAGEKKVSILDAGHRAGDALVRCTELKDALQNAFQALKKGDVVPLAKLAPTSLVFGVWDSRDTQAKAPRLLAATIRAFNVAKLTRSAQYNPAIEYVEEGFSRRLKTRTRSKPIRSEASATCRHRRHMAASSRRVRFGGR